jgi:hypothetical protein
VDVVAKCHASQDETAHWPPPPPPHLPADPPTFVVASGRCTTSPDGSCFRSPNYPNNYGNLETCEIRVHGNGGARATDFHTEVGNYDYLTLSEFTTRFAGTGGHLGPQGVGIPVLDGQTFAWRTDSSNVESGFEICGMVLPCGDHGIANVNGTACECAPAYYGGAVLAPGGSGLPCMEGAFAPQYEVTGCNDPENCGIFSVVEAYCTGSQCDQLQPTTCGDAPVYQQLNGGLLGGERRVLLRWRLHDGSSQWRIAGANALTDCLGLPYAHSASHNGAVGYADDSGSYLGWQESANSGWAGSTLVIAAVGGSKFTVPEPEPHGAGH